MYCKIRIVIAGVKIERAAPRMNQSTPYIDHMIKGLVELNDFVYYTSCPLLGVKF